MTFLWIYLPIVLLLCMCIRNLKWQNLLLVAASLLFYAWGEPRNIFLILFSILLNYGFGLLVSRVQHHQKLVLAICVLLNLALLFYYKYYTFFFNAVLTRFGVTGNVSIALPIGISFFTFQALSYVVDVYRDRNTEHGVVAQRNVINLALYISLFSQLIAGPIVKYKAIDAQLEEREMTLDEAAYGVKRFVLGLSKKVLISNTMAAAADAIFGLSAQELGTSVAWIGAICYSMQIYFDFSGYSDMAIGLGKMLGFSFMENFNYPYLSKSIGEFWRRWHISLSTWFREYLYIPLGGNRKGKRRTYVNLLLVFLATGIWHGANWTFLLWGLFHGVFIVLERAWLAEKLRKHPVLATVYTLLVVLCGWVLFRADSLSQAAFYLRAMFVWTPCGALSTPAFFINALTVTAAVVALLLCGPLQAVVPGMKRWIYDEDRISWSHSLLLIPLLGLCILCLSSGAYNPFIYFRF